MRFVKQFGAVALVAVIGSRVVAGLEGHPWLVLVAGVLTALALILAYGRVVGRTEHRDPVEVDRTGAAGAVGRGALIGGPGPPRPTVAGSSPRPPGPPSGPGSPGTSTTS